MSSGHQGVNVGMTAELFRRYSFIEQSCVRALAGWFLKAPDWEMKIQLGYALFAHAERVYELHGRLEELRGGNRHANVDPLLERFGEGILHAPDAYSFTAGLVMVLKELLSAYQSYMDAADASANAMEIRILQRAIPDVTAEIARLSPWIGRGAEQTIMNWQRFLGDLIDQAGGLDGMAPRASTEALTPIEIRFEWPTPMIFDHRLSTSDLGTYESKKALPLRERCIGEFEVYFNEFYAAALLATVIFDSWRIHAPRQYFMDIAHHFWDEVRHAEFGAIRLRELGIEPHKVNMSLFEKSKQMPIVHRICYLTLGLEVFFMPRKSERARYYEEQGDTLSQLFATVDWSDEINHVRYGKQWVDYFLKDDNRSVEDIQAEIAGYLQGSSSPAADRLAPW
jgi:hypothetical protein